MEQIVIVWPDGCWVYEDEANSDYDYKSDNVQYLLVDEDMSEDDVEKLVAKFVGAPYGINA